MKLYIKNMVCRRCKIIVGTELEKLGLHPISVELGEVELEETTIDNIRPQLIRKLQSFGFELINDKNSRTVERIKTLIIDLVQNKNKPIKTNLSDYLAGHIGQEYSSLSRLFSATEANTIEHFFIAQKIEKVKELLTYNEMTLSEIAYQLNYSSTAHLSNQFKKTTGLSPSYFKKLKEKKRRQIDEL